MWRSGSPGVRASRRSIPSPVRTAASSVPERCRRRAGVRSSPAARRSWNRSIARSAISDLTWAPFLLDQGRERSGVGLQRGVELADEHGPEQCVENQPGNDKHGGRTGADAQQQAGSQRPDHGSAPQHVALSATRVDESGQSRGLDLLAQVAHVNVHDVALRVRVKIVDVLPDVGSRDDVARTSGQVLQQRVFAGGQVQQSAGAPRSGRRCRFRGRRRAGRGREDRIFDAPASEPAPAVRRARTV